MDLIEINYKLARFIKNSNQEELSIFYTISKTVLNQIYQTVDDDDCHEDTKLVNACASILSNCIYLDIPINIEIIPKILNLYHHTSYQSTIDVLLQNLAVDPRYNPILMNQPNLYDCISIYIYRGLCQLLTSIKSGAKIEDDVVSTLLYFVYEYLLHHELNDTTRDTFHDCLFVLVNCAYRDYIQPEFIPMVIQLYKTTNCIETKYLALNYLYNIHHDVYYTKYLMPNQFTILVKDFCNGDSGGRTRYPDFCTVLEVEYKNRPVTV